MATVALQNMKKHNVSTKYFIVNLQRGQKAMIHVVCGGPLTGKTTFLRKSCLELVEFGKTSLQKAPFVPVYIDLKMLVQRQPSLIDNLNSISDKKVFLQKK